MINIIVDPKIRSLLQHVLVGPSAIHNSTGLCHQMTASNEAVHQNQLSVGLMAACRSSNYTHSSNVIRYTERSEPLDVCQRTPNFTKLGREVENDVDLGDT